MSVPRRMTLRSDAARERSMQGSGMGESTSSVGPIRSRSQSEHWHTIRTVNRSRSSTPFIEVPANESQEPQRFSSRMERSLQRRFSAGPDSPYRRSIIRIPGISRMESSSSSPTVSQYETTQAPARRATTPRVRYITYDDYRPVDRSNGQEFTTRRTRHGVLIEDRAHPRMTARPIRFRRMRIPAMTGLFRRALRNIRDSIPETGIPAEGIINQPRNGNGTASTALMTMAYRLRDSMEDGDDTPWQILFIRRLLESATDVDEAMDNLMFWGGVTPPPHPPVPDHYIDTLPTWKYKLQARRETNSRYNLRSRKESWKGDSLCIVCREEYAGGEEVCKLPCAHLFHKDCIVPWLRAGNHNCPICRHPTQKSSSNTDDVDDLSYM